MTRSQRSLAVYALLAALAAVATLPRPAVAGIDRFTAYGPWNGQIVADAIDPSAPESLLTITDFYGLYRSDDGGLTWAFSGAGLDQDPEQGIAADPANPGSFYLVTSTEAFHSIDSGRSWARIASGLNFRAPIFPHGRALPVLKILPAGRGALPTLLVATTQGLYRSGDGGVTWSLVYTLNFLVLSWGPVVDPTDPRRLWLTPPDPTGGRLLTSTDGGLTFTPVPNPPEPLVVTLVVPTSPVTIFATGLNGLWKSTDNGASWRKIPQTVLPMAYETGTPSIVYATAGSGFFWSSDAGETWAPRGAGLPAAGIALLQAAPGTRTLYGTSILDVFRSVDRGRHWALVAESGVGEGFPTRLRFRPGAPSTVYAVRGGEGYRSTNGGATWASLGNLAPTSERSTAIRDLAIDPANPDLLSVATDKGIFDSTDGGDSWNAVSSQLFSILAPAGRRRVLLGGSCALERSRDGGRTWSVTLPCPAGNPKVTRRIDRLVVDPRNPDTVYAGGVDIGGQDGQVQPSRIWQSTDAGASWQRIVADGEVLALDPSRSGRLYAIRAGGLFRSDDAGRTFRQISSFAASGSGLTATDLLVDPVTPSTLYAATSGQGVWRSIDSGVTWAPENAGLARYGNLLAQGLVLDPAVPHRLYAIVDTAILTNQLTEP